MEDEEYMDEEDFSFIEDSVTASGEVGDGGENSVSHPLSISGSSGARKRKPLKKAPDAPKRFKSAYICFVAEKMDDVKKGMPSDIKVRKFVEEFFYFSFFLNKNSNPIIGD